MTARHNDSSSVERPRMRSRRQARNAFSMARDKGRARFRQSLPTRADEARARHYFNFAARSVVAAFNGPNDQAGRVTDGARIVVDSSKHYQARERSTLSGATTSTRRVPI